MNKRSDRKKNSCNLREGRRNKRASEELSILKRPRQRKTNSEKGTVFNILLFAFITGC